MDWWALHEKDDEYTGIKRLFASSGMGKVRRERSCSRAGMHTCSWGLKERGAAPRTASCEP